MIQAPLLLGGNVVLALTAALTWGGGDFAGGMSVKRAGGSVRSAFRCVLLSHGASLAVLLLLILLRRDAVPHGAPLLWGLAAGFLGSTSVLCFYICLARGAMGASAAISGLLAAAIPSLVSGLLEGAPAAPHLAGFLLAACAIWLIAAGPQAEATPPGTLPLSIAAGTGFGLYFVALRMAGTAGILWPLALSRSMSLVVCLLGLAWMASRSRGARAPKHSLITGANAPASINLTSIRFTHRNSASFAAPWLHRSAVYWAFTAALLDTSGNLFFIAATRAGRLDVAAVLASLYPASTILLAAWLLRERPGRQQAAGMVLAVLAVILITL